MKYYYAKNGQQAGPVDESELIGLGVTRDTLVWCNGMAEWTKAGKVSALAYLFAPLTSQTATYDFRKPERPKSHLAFAILATIFCCWPFGIPGIVYAALVERRYNNGDYEGAKKASKTALMWTLISFFVGLICILLVVALYVFLGASIFAGLEELSYY